MVKIFIDPGHGGADTGVEANGLQEKTLTLTIALKVKEILESEYLSAFVMLSRDKDETRTLIERTNAANQWGADVYLAIHMNAGGGSGYVDYVCTKADDLTFQVQNCIHQEMLKIIYLKDRGKKSASFHVLRESVMPAVLTESGFVDNINDAEILKSDLFLEKIARGHVNGLVKAFELQAKELPVKSLKIPDSQKTNADRANYKIQAEDVTNFPTRKIQVPDIKTDVVNRNSQVRRNDLRSEKRHIRSRISHAPVIDLLKQEKLIRQIKK